MTLSKEHQDFLEAMEIDIERFTALNRDAQILIDIATDYEIHRVGLLDEANYIANKLQRCKDVHSVRSRVKATSHLVEKIIRKWEDDPVSEKYNTISHENYKSIISDLVGVRAIYLFKKDWETIHRYILSRWVPIEKVVIYHRSGDDSSKYQEFSDCDPQIHPKGYRSIHYIVPATKINGEQVNCEIQTRTIFEEGWSEIDHQVRYPSFSDNAYLQEFLNIFNRVSGTADEMGSFVDSLRELIEENSKSEKQRQEHERNIERLQSEIALLFDKGAELEELKEKYEELKNERISRDRLILQSSFHDDILTGKSLSFDNLITHRYEHLKLATDRRGSIIAKHIDKKQKKDSDDKDD